MAPGFTKGPERVVYDGYVIQVAVGEFVGPNGEVVERDLIHHPGAVSVVPIDGDDVILVRQYRAALGLDLLEIPAGKRDVSDEPLEVCARRELAEEVGMQAASLVKVASFSTRPGSVTSSVMCSSVPSSPRCLARRTGSKRSTWRSSATSSTMCPQ